MNSKLYRWSASLLCLSLLSAGCASGSSSSSAASNEKQKAYIEDLLNLANNEQQTWTYDSASDSWTLAVVSAVAYPEIEDQQGVSVNVPGAYVKGLDTDGDGSVDVTAAQVQESTAGSLVIDNEATVTSTSGQVYTASSAPVILNTGAAGYGSSVNTPAPSTYAAEGYINVTCGNRGKQDTAEDANGNTYYTGDAPSCLVDQKNAARFVKYNILLGNLPGNVDAFVSTGGSGGGAHAVMFAATSNHPDFYDYEIEAGAVGVYKAEDGSYVTTVSIDGQEVPVSDGAWGTVAYSPITSLASADMAMAFEYTLDADYEFGSPFQKELASLLSAEYMNWVNDQNFSVLEREVGFDLNQDGDLSDTIDLTIEYDLEAHPETNGYYGSYLDLYLAEFQSNLQWYLDHLDYAQDWTWFDEEGNALSDEQAAAMTLEEKQTAFLSGNYAASSSRGKGAMGQMTFERAAGERPDVGDENFGGKGQGMKGPMNGQLPDDAQIDFDGEFTPDFDGGLDGGFTPDFDGEGPDFDMPANGDTMIVGTPDAGTTQAAGSSLDSNTYASFEDMLEAYRKDIEELEAGDKYGNNLVSLYDPMQYIGDESTDNPTWVRMMMGASEGDMSMFSSLNLQLAMLEAGVDAQVEWQWDGGHVPSEIFDMSLPLYVDTMVAKHADGVQVSASQPETQTANGTATEPSGKDISDWVDSEDLSSVSFSLADAAAYRTAGASKAIPGFDVIDYGQEDYVFGSASQDARHWNRTLLDVFEANKEVLSSLFAASQN